ncbi:phosphonate C-P lyase system protein PhnL [Azorhizobium doebereinerae]|uniref:phosphonate C-P lyase system protein PhnL n=1 Tax=Azorhizobium doebereinerae TaxID=281091 RepID=UPI000421C363|nr:phosphonate C-P lyase system protein PhnL [Azorhizobium doebereinerae]
MTLHTSPAAGAPVPAPLLPPGTLLRVENLAKAFTLHLRGGTRLPVVEGATLEVRAGTCVALGGPSGAGKSSILKMVYGNYRTDAGAIWLADDDGAVDVAHAAPRRMLDLRRRRIGYVSQFLRVIPRVAALDVVAEPLIAEGTAPEQARETAKALLARLNLPERLWGLPPATFSGGEQQRVNVARGFIASQPLLLLDEPTASLDAVNRQVVIDLIAEKKAGGTGLLGIFHDADTREAVADAVVDVSAFARRAQ